MKSQFINILVWILFVLIKSGLTQAFEISKIEPPNWWTGMQYNKVQLMLYGAELDLKSASFNTSQIQIVKIHNMKNKDYSFIDIMIGQDCEPGVYTLSIFTVNQKQEIKFPILDRDNRKNRYQGFGPEDIIYLITPDRFANGDTINDTIEGMRDHADRNDILRRHGGDIQGIIDRLDYIKDFGFTAIWINPLVENDMDISYHGYAATDLYKIDPRFGSNELYIELIEKAHKMGLKIILDHVANHVGMYHSWVSNPPTNDWFHGTLENHAQAFHDKSILLDPYALPRFKGRVKKGWFVTEMPDLNQSNPFVKNYLIQNTIWWIESTGLDGIREDTYPYADQEFMTEWANVIFKEYAQFNIVGEVWINDPVFLSFFQTNSHDNQPFNTHLKTITDFGILTALGNMLHQDGSIKQIYNILQKDILYADPNMLMTFADNHDIMRLWDLCRSDVAKYKMALTLLLTIRGIPQIFYGTEIGMRGGDDHGLVRRDMPGGFPKDEINVFNKKGLNAEQISIYNHLKKLLSIRKKYDAFVAGDFIHFPPNEEIYYYFRMFDRQKFLVIVNNNNIPKKIKLSEVLEAKDNNFEFLDVINDLVLKVKENQYFELDRYGSYILKISEN